MCHTAKASDTESQIFEVDPFTEAIEIADEQTSFAVAGEDMAVNPGGCIRPPDMQGLAYLMAVLLQLGRLCQGRARLDFRLAFLFVGSLRGWRGSGRGRASGNSCWIPSRRRGRGRGRGRGRRQSER